MFNPKSNRNMEKKKRAPKVYGKSGYHTREMLIERIAKLQSSLEAKGEELVKEEAKSAQYYQWYRDELVVTKSLKEALEEKERFLAFLIHISAREFSNKVEKAE